MLANNKVKLLNLTSLKPKNIKIIDPDLGDIDSKKFLYYENLAKKFFVNNNLILFLGDNDSESIAFYLIFLRYKQCQILLEQNINFSNLKLIIKKFQPDFLFCPKNIDVPKNYLIIFQLKKYYFLKKRTKSKLKIDKNLAILISTSGTTGVSKFVKLSFDNIINNSISIQSYLKLNKKDVGITTLPLAYSYGLSVINIHLLQDLKIVCNKKSIIEKGFWDLISKYKVTNFSGVPFTFEMFDKLNFYEKNLFNLRFVTQAGGRLNNNIIFKICNNFEKKKINFFVMYGQTEASPRISYIELKNLKKKINSVGQVIKGGKISINQKNQEIIYEGLNIFKGYALERKDLVYCENIKKLKTGDKGYLDSENYLYITGRIKRDVKIYGKRLNLDILEKFLYNRFRDKVLCKSNENQIIIFGIKKQNEKKIKKVISSEFGLPVLSVRFKKISKFPINKNNKIDYSKLKF
jgi:long-chain acyl-CoA synthetase